MRYRLEDVWTPPISIGLETSIMVSPNWIVYSSASEHPSPIYAEQSIFSNYVESLCIDIVISTLRNEALSPFWNDMLILPRYELLTFTGISKELGKQGYNYLTKENVFKILDKMTELNPKDKKLSGIKYRLITSIERKT